MTPTPETKPRSILWMIAHDDWCSHDETDDGIECDCHLSVIASLSKRLEAAEKMWREDLQSLWVYDGWPNKRDEKDIDAHMAERIAALAGEK